MGLADIKRFTILPVEHEEIKTIVSHPNNFDKEINTAGFKSLIWSQLYFGPLLRHHAFNISHSLHFPSMGCSPKHTIHLLLLWLLFNVIEPLCGAVSQLVYRHLVYRESRDRVNQEKSLFWTSVLL